MASGDKHTTGRVTPKGSQGGRVTPKGSQQNKAQPSQGRYTPPIPKEYKISPRWVPILMFSLLGLGMLLIVCNYLGILPGGAKNSYLLIGLGLITGWLRYRHPLPLADQPVNAKRRLTYTDVILPRLLPTMGTTG